MVDFVRGNNNNTRTFTGCSSGDIRIVKLALLPLSKDRGYCLVFFIYLLFPRMHSRVFTSTFYHFHFIVPVPMIPSSE